MEIILENVSKKYNRDWIFKDVNFHFEHNKSYAITGNNGSGKSTLLQLILGYQTLSLGRISYKKNTQEISEEEVYTNVSFAAPYLELIDEFTLMESVQFHFKLKEPRPNTDYKEIINSAGLSGNENKQVKFFSSGMKQRLKIALAINTESSLLLLDEPCSNFDKNGIEWYRKLILAEDLKRTIIIASNQDYEYDFCSQSIDIHNFKPKPKG